MTNERESTATAASVLSQSDFVQVSSRELQDWRDRLSCTASRLQQEIGIRMYRCRPHPEADVGTESQTAFDWITHACQAAFGARHVFLWVLDPSGSELALASSDPAVAVDSGCVPEGPVRWVSRARKALLLGPSVLPRRSTEFESKVHPNRSTMIAPIMLGEILMGVLEVRAESSQDYDEDDLQTLRFIVEVAAVCCHLAVQTRRLERAMALVDRSLATPDRDVARRAA